MQKEQRTTRKEVTNVGGGGGGLNWGWGARFGDGGGLGGRVGRAWNLTGQWWGWVERVGGAGSSI